MRVVTPILLAVLGTLPTHAEDWTVGDTTYHDVTVTRIDAGKIHIMYDGGVTSVNLADLPPDLQKRFGYAPDDTDAGTNASPQDPPTPTVTALSPADIAREIQRYRAKVYRAVGDSWRAKVAPLLDMLPAGTVRIKYTANSDGTVEIKPPPKTDKDELLTSLSIQAIQDASPFPTFSDTLLKQMGDSYTDTFVFTISETKVASVK